MQIEVKFAYLGYICDILYDLYTLLYMIYYKKKLYPQILTHLSNPSLHIWHVPTLLSSAGYQSKLGSCMTDFMVALHAINVYASVILMHRPYWFHKARS